MSRGHGIWGALVPALPAHGALQDEEDGGGRHGTQAAWRTQYAYTDTGRKQVLRRWNIRTGRWTWTTAGGDYDARNSQRVVPDIP